MTNSKNTELLKTGCQVDLLHKYCHSNAKEHGSHNYELCYYSCTNLWQAAVFGAGRDTETLAEGGSPQEAMDELMKKLFIGGPQSYE